MVKIADCFLHWNPTPDADEELASADVIVTHDFGDQETTSLATEDIARLGAGLARRFKKPLVCQIPGDGVARSEGVVPSLVITSHLLRRDEYLDTEEVHRQLARHCWVKGWDKVIVCTHPHHAWRAAQNLKRHGLTPLLPDLSSIRYDPECPRKALSSPARYIVSWEIPARVLYLWKGYM